MVRDHQDRVPDPDQSPFPAPPSGQAPVLRGQVSVFGVAGGSGSLHQSPFQPAVAWRDKSAASLTCAFFIAGTHPRPRGAVLMRRKGGHLRSSFGRHHVSGNGSISSLDYDTLIRIQRHGYCTVHNSNCTNILVCINRNTSHCYSLPLWPFCRQFPPF